MLIKLDCPLMLSEIAKAINGRMTSEDTLIEYVSSDSRTMCPSAIFFALGKGESFIGEAMLTGSAVGIKSGSITVDDTEDALLSFASHYISLLKELRHIIAVTGSVGKTTVKDFAASILGQKYCVHKTLGNFNNSIGLPLSVLGAPHNTEILILEMGMNHIGEIKRLSEAVRPDIAIITVIGTAHIGNLGSREAIAKAKLEITAGMPDDGTLIIPSDEPLLSSVRMNRITVGPNGDLSVEVTGADIRSSAFRLKMSSGLIEGELPFGGLHLVKDLSLAAAAALRSGMTASELQAALKSSYLFYPRNDLISIADFTVLDDSYNASLESYTAAFELLSKHRGSTSAVIGDVLEAGTEAAEIHREIGKRAALTGIGSLYPFGNFSEYVRQGALEAGFAESRIHSNGDACAHERTSKMILDNLIPGELILIKGSHAMKTERIIKHLKEAKGE